MLHLVPPEQWVHHHIVQGQDIALDYWSGGKSLQFDRIYYYFPSWLFVLMVTSDWFLLQLHHWGWGRPIRCQSFVFPLKYIYTSSQVMRIFTKFHISYMIDSSYFSSVFKFFIKVYSVFDDEGFGLAFHGFTSLICCLGYWIDCFWISPVRCLREFDERLS